MSIIYSIWGLTDYVFFCYFYCYTPIIFTIHVCTLLTILIQLLTLLTVLHLLTLHYNTCFMPVCKIITPKLHYSQYGSKNHSISTLIYRWQIKVPSPCTNPTPHLICPCYGISINTYNLFCFVLNFCL